jgi:bifunctional aspartokinase / homoserine dehydrogenase 1
MKVLKFGGSSVKNAERIQQVSDILEEYKGKEERFVVVFSAFGGVTDLLLGMGVCAAKADDTYLKELERFKERHYPVIDTLLTGEYQLTAQTFMDARVAEMEDILKGIFLLREGTKRAFDYLASFGERCSAFIISEYFKQQGNPVAYLDARQLIRTNDNFGNAIVDSATTTQQIVDFFASVAGNFVTTGFIGSTAEGSTTTLGRGGSDYTAAIFGACLKADVIEIWTDVDGVMTADPRKVKNAFTVPQMTYAEAMEMSHFGAKVIYPPTILPAMECNIPLSIRNTYNPAFKGTFISHESVETDAILSGVTSISKIVLLTLQGSGMFGVSGIAARLFDALAKTNVNIILITQGSSEHSITCAISTSDKASAENAIASAFDYELKRGQVDPLILEENLSIIAIVGERMRSRPGMAAQLFTALGKNGINVVAIAQGSSELNISIVIESKDETKALNAVHERFFYSDTKDIHLFFVGVGLIGSSLLNQIQKQAAYLKEQKNLDIKVVGLANTQKMVFNENGIDLANWKGELEQSVQTSDLSGFVEEMASLNLRNSIFVDNTASAAPVDYYEKILKSSISISTPNKIATSSSYKQYRHFKQLADKNNVQFQYETNVGAGLPIISTLKGLVDSGDKVLKIEGVLSGSLSFIFNNFTSDASFYDIVKQAQKLGYTEPDPRIDLSGKDVRRKILILGREAGFSLEAEEVEIENILPQPCIDAQTIEAFFAALKSNEQDFVERISKASAADKRLRFIASLDNGVAKISLQEVDSSNPFYSLSGSDNMIVFTTERYKERPLVVRGPGAGAEVTAAGVFAEIISIASFLG